MERDERRKGGKDLGVGSGHLDLTDSAVKVHRLVGSVIGIAAAEEKTKKK